MRIVSGAQIEGDFEGMDFDRIFELTNGEKWQQAEGRYRYQYRYRPHARVVEERGEYYLHVDGFGEKIRVRKVSA